MALDLSSSGSATTLASGRTHPKSVAGDAPHVYYTSEVSAQLFMLTK